MDPQKILLADHHIGLVTTCHINRNGTKIDLTGLNYYEQQYNNLV